MEDRRDRDEWAPETGSAAREDEEAILDELGIHGAARRIFLGQSIAGGLGVFALQLLTGENAAMAAPGAASPPAASTPDGIRVALKINGEPRTLDLDSRTVLLDALRERLGMTGTKKGCDQGQC